MSKESSVEKREWPHAPTHKLSEAGTYFVTAGTYLKEHHFMDRQRLDELQRDLISMTNDFGWQMEAWAIFPNHYHFVAHSPEGEGTSLKPMLGLLHENTSKWVNDLDNTPGRKVWCNFWDTLLTFEKSYLARLKYVHWNPVKHDLLQEPAAYPWCSAAWFERTTRPAMVKTIYGFKIDKLNVMDDFDVPREVFRL